jgi:predicted site-specific integrase-resolvase
VQTMDVNPVTIEGSLEATLWSTQEAADAAGVSYNVIAWWAHRGYLKRANPGRSRIPLYRASDVLKAEHEVRSRRTVKPRSAA